MHLHPDFSAKEPRRLRNPSPITGNYVWPQARRVRAPVRLQTAPRLIHLEHPLPRTPGSFEGVKYRTSTPLLRSRTSSQRRSRRAESPRGSPGVCRDGGVAGRLPPCSPRGIAGACRARAEHRVGRWAAGGGGGPSPRGGPACCNPRPSRQSQVLSFATGRSCGASARVRGRGVLSRRGPRPALHHGLATASDRGEDAMPDRRNPPPLAQSRPRDELCGTSALGRAPPRPPPPSSGSARRTRSRPDPDRAPRPERAHLGRSSPPGKGTAPDAPQRTTAAVTNLEPRQHSASSSVVDADGSRSLG